MGRDLGRNMGGDLMKSGREIWGEIWGRSGGGGWEEGGERRAYEFASSEKDFKSIEYLMFIFYISFLKFRISII